MLTYKELEKFLNYLLDKVDDIYLNEMEKLTTEFLNNYKKYGSKEYTASDLIILFTILKDNIADIYKCETDNAIAELSRELKIRQTIINARKNMDI